MPPFVQLVLETQTSNPPKLNLLLVCIENCNRSQMAQAFACIHGGESVQAFSAGSKPSGQVNPRAIAAMREIGCDLSNHESTSLNVLPEIQFDAVVTLGCGDACPFVPAKQRIDWQIPDPCEKPPLEFNQVRDLISGKVKKLIEELN